jgi:hypothetical protein
MLYKFFFFFSGFTYCDLGSFCVNTPLFVLVDPVFLSRWILVLYVVFSFDCYSSIPFCFVNPVDMDVEGV